MIVAPSIRIRTRIRTEKTPEGVTVHLLPDLDFSRFNRKPAPEVEL